MIFPSSLFIYFLTLGVGVGASEISRMESVGIGVDVNDDDDDDPDRITASQYKAFRQGKQLVGCVDEVAKYLMENIEGEKEKTFNILAW